MYRKIPLLLIVLACFIPLFASAGNLISDGFDNTDIAFDIGGVETVTEGNGFSTAPFEGCSVEYTVPVDLGATSVDVLEPNHPFGPAVNFFGGATGSSQLQTQLVTVVGETYTIAFNLKQIGTFSDHKIIATAGGATSGEVGPGTHTFSFIASDSSTTLTFTGVICTIGTCNAGSDIALDNLSVDTSASVLDCVGEEPNLDTDADGIADAQDLCPETESGALVDITGCSIAQYCGCDDFKRHGQYVACTARTTEAFLQDGLITELEKNKIIRTAAKSSCGKPAKKKYKHYDKYNKYNKYYKHSYKHSYKYKHSKTSKRKYKNKSKHNEKKSYQKRPYFTYKY